MNSTRIAEKRAKILRPILEIEKKDLPVSQALEDAAWELGLSKSHTWSLYRARPVKALWCEVCDLCYAA